jgi:hypothetical protein
LYGGLEAIQTLTPSERNKQSGVGFGEAMAGSMSRPETEQGFGESLVKDPYNVLFAGTGGALANVGAKGAQYLPKFGAIAKHGIPAVAETGLVTGLETAEQATTGQNVTPVENLQGNLLGGLASGLLPSAGGFLKDRGYERFKSIIPKARHRDMMASGREPIIRKTYENLDAERYGFLPRGDYRSQDRIRQIDADISRLGEQKQEAYKSAEDVLGSLDKKSSNAEGVLEYFHGSPENVTNLKSNEKGFSFISPDRDLAYEYGKRKGSEPFVKSVNAEGLKIFDYNDPNHISEFESFVGSLDNFEKNKLLSYYEKSDLEGGRWFDLENIFSKNEGRRFLNDMGYDGLKVSERGVDNIALINPKKVSIGEAVTATKKAQDKPKTFIDDAFDDELMKINKSAEANVINPRARTEILTELNDFKQQHFKEVRIPKTKNEGFDSAIAHLESEDIITGETISDINKMFNARKAIDKESQKLYNKIGKDKKLDDKDQAKLFSRRLLNNAIDDKIGAIRTLAMESGDESIISAMKKIDADLGEAKELSSLYGQLELLSNMGGGILTESTPYSFTATGAMSKIPFGNQVYPPSGIRERQLGKLMTQQPTLAPIKATAYRDEQ